MVSFLLPSFSKVAKLVSGLSVRAPSSRVKRKLDVVHMQHLSCVNAKRLLRDQWIYKGVNIISPMLPSRNNLTIYSSLTLCISKADDYMIRARCARLSVCGRARSTAANTWTGLVHLFHVHLLFYHLDSSSSRSLQSARSHTTTFSVLGQHSSYHMPSETRGSPIVTGRCWTVHYVINTATRLPGNTFSSLRSGNDLRLGSFSVSDPRRFSLFSLNVPTIVDWVPLSLFHRPGCLGGTRPFFSVFFCSSFSLLKSPLKVTPSQAVPLISVYGQTILR